MTEQQQEILNRLREYIEEYFGKSQLMEQADITFLRFTPTLYTDNTGMVLMEVCLIGYSEEITIAQVYTTMLARPEAALEKLRPQLEEWNFRSLTGSYGIYEKQGQLYHKQNIALPTGAMVGDQVEFLFTGICAAMEEMARRLPEAIALTDGQADGPQESETGQA